MANFITLLCIFGLVGFPTLMNCFCYPISHKLAVFWSDYIVHVCAPGVFAILKTYRHFDFLGDKESKKQLPEQYLILSNHQSLLDIPVYMNFMRDKDLRFVAKEQLGSVPMVGHMLRAHEHCMIPRTGKTMVAMNALEKFGKRVRERNQIPIIFPEGTRSKNGELGKFYAAGFRKLSESAGLPVAVCALDGGWKIRTISQLMTNLKGGNYKVKVLKVYPAPQTKEDQVKILEESRELIQKQLEEWRSQDKMN